MKTLHVFVFAAVVLAGTAVAAASRQASLDAWLGAELTRYVAEQLGTHPRFKGQSLRFVVFDNGNPQATTNALAIRIRDRLRDAARGVPGVRLAWQPDNPHFLRHGGPGGIDCTKTEVDYLIGVELNLDGSGLLSVGIRALDIEERTVVPDFGKTWRGPISSREYREYRRSETDPTFRGERDVPYDPTQTDLLAAHLAHDLGCTLLRQTEAEYIIADSDNGKGIGPVQNLVELVSNNLAQYNALQYASTDESANAVIEGKAHRIDVDLYQYWITVHPRDAGSDHNALSASAYVRLPERFAIAQAHAGPESARLESKAGFLDTLEIVEVGDPRACVTKSIGSVSPRNGRPYLHNTHCFALSVRSESDAVVFFLNHQLNNGLVRLAAASCLQANSARIAKSDRRLHFPLPPDSLTSAAWFAGDGWPLYPDLDAYYVVASNDTKAARELSRHIRQLPKRCTASVRQGLEGIALRQWLDELSRILERWGPAIDWQTIRVRNVY